MIMELDTFMQLKNEVDSATRATFTERMRYVHSKFISLSNANIYKRIQKVQFINTPKNTNNIIHILNKLTADNYEQIKTKIYMKNTSENTEDFMEQIIKYSIHSQINSKYLLALCNDLIVKHSDDTKLAAFTKELLVQYFVKYLNYFDDFENADENNYSGFINKNEQNAFQLNRCNFILLVLSSRNHIQTMFSGDEQYNSVNLLRILLQKAETCMLSNPYENKLSVILDSIKKIFSCCSKGSIMNKELVVMVDLFQSVFETNLVKGLNNKLRFKVLDIIDIINKER